MTYVLGFLQTYNPLIKASFSLHITSVPEGFQGIDILSDGRIQYNPAMNGTNTWSVNPQDLKKVGGFGSIETSDPQAYISLTFQGMSRPL